MNDSELIRFYANNDAIRVDAGLLEDLPAFLQPSPQLAACWEIPPDQASLPLQASISADVFQLDSAIKDQLPNKIDTGLAEANFVVRLNALKQNKSEWRAELKLANYFDSARCNFAMETIMDDGNSLRQKLHRAQQSVGSIESNPLVNHIGVVGMVQTFDERWIIPQRSGKVLNRQRTSSASVSGAVSPVDLGSPQDLEDGYLDLHQALSHAVRREAHEELGIPLSHVQLLGILREYHRGGKPEAYFVARTPLNFDRVVQRHLEAGDAGENSRLLSWPEASSTPTLVENALSSSAPANFTLRAGLALALAALRE